MTFTVSEGDSDVLGDTKLMKGYTNACIEVAKKNPGIMHVDPMSPGLSEYKPSVQFLSTCTKKAFDESPATEMVLVDSDEMARLLGEGYPIVENCVKYTGSDDMDETRDTCGMIVPEGIAVIVANTDKEGAPRSWKWSN